jgi:hypothetical protein
MLCLFSILTKIDVNDLALHYVPDGLVNFGILAKRKRTFFDFTLVFARTIIPSQNLILTYVHEADPIWTRRLQKIIEEGRANVDKNNVHPLH